MIATRTTWTRLLLLAIRSARGVSVSHGLFCHFKVIVFTYIITSLQVWWAEAAIEYVLVTTVVCRHTRSSHSISFSRCRRCCCCHSSHCGVAGRGGGGPDTLSCPVGSMWNVKIRWEFFRAGVGWEGRQPPMTNSVPTLEPSNPPTPLSSHNFSHSIWILKYM